MRLRLELDQETHDALLKAALVEKRPIDWQAEVILRRALGLPFPRADKNVPSTPNPEAMKEVRHAAR
jgi:hypothetical protein